jgi:hypothetical protein
MEITATGNTLLTYAMLVEPDPLQVTTSAILTLLVSNSGNELVTCTSIVVTLPKGTFAKDLTEDPTGIETVVPDGWAVTPAENVFTFTPSATAGPIGPQGIPFTFAAVKVNGEPGTATITIDETASPPSQPDPRTASIEVPKFPVEFQLSELTSTPSVPSGGSATLNWTGQGDDVAYVITYLPTDTDELVKGTVGEHGPYQSEPLTRSGSVLFTLTASVTVLGQDELLVVTRTLTMPIVTMSIASFDLQPPAVGVNGLVVLTWDVPNADHCTLEDGTVLPASGTRGFVLPALPAKRTFTFTAHGFDGRTLEQQITVVVDPSIVATPEEGFVITGAPGALGLFGTPAIGFDSNPTAGGIGGRGQDAVLSGPIPPLDTTVKPVRVLPIVLTGGKGGTGGPGGADFINFPPIEFLFGPGGEGGRGGDAIINVTLDASAGPAASYLVTLTPGVGGVGGITTIPGDGGVPLGPDPEAGGGPGAVSIIINGNSFEPEVGISQLTSSKPAVAEAEALDLSWQVQYATSLKLQLSQLPDLVDVSGLSGCTVVASGVTLCVSAAGKPLGTLTPPAPFPQSLDFVLTASDGSSSVQSSVQVCFASGTLLAYAIQVNSEVLADNDPNGMLIATRNPLLVNESGNFYLLMMISRTDPVTCTSLVVSIPVGTDANHLTADPTGIQAGVKNYGLEGGDDWDVAQDGGVFTFTPRGNAGTIKWDALLLFGFQSIAVNGEPGTATITIEETASLPLLPTPATRTTELSVLKFPVQ